MLILILIRHSTPHKKMTLGNWNDPGSKGNLTSGKTSFIKWKIFCEFISQNGDSPPTAVWSISFWEMKSGHLRSFNILCIFWSNQWILEIYRFLIRDQLHHLEHTLQWAWRLRPRGGHKTIFGASEKWLGMYVLELLAELIKNKGPFSLYTPTRSGM